MAGQKIPYPPSPENVPDDLTDFPDSYRSQQNLLLAGLFIFLLFYLGLICLCLLLGTWCAVTVNHYFPLKLVGLIVCGLGFLFLVKGFFKRQPIDKEMHIEITEEEHPVLFGFIHKLCDELDAPEPDRVVVSPDVNAAMMHRTTLVNLFVEPKKDLVVGLGLVNCMNLTEFKSVLAHEFGHFLQSDRASCYTNVVRRIIFDMVEGEDWFDRMINYCKRQENVVSIFGYLVGAPLWVGRKVLGWVLQAITLQRLAISREAEFHADLVAVKAAGSDAVGLSLMRLRFGNLCLMQALHDLSEAADRKLYTRDMFFHQERSEPVVRRKKKDPSLGARPVYDDPMDGKDHRVFDPDEEEWEYEDIPEMLRTHPPGHETEENAKATFVPAVVDIRSPWVLFTDAADLKERMTYKFYRRVFKIRKDTDLEEPEKVQAYIDGEHADTTYDPRYKGIYDDRKLDPGDIAELNQVVRESPWAEDRINKVFEKLYEGAAGKHEEYEELREDRAALENTPGQLTGRMKRKIEKIEKRQDKVWEWFQSFDRRVYLVHVQMGQFVNREWADELVERYRFQMEIQRLYLEARYHQGKAYAFATFLFNLPQDEVHPDLMADVMQVLREAWRALKNILKDAREINLPAMRNFEEGERLADFILEEKMVPELPLTYVKGKWVGKLLDQLETVKNRCFRLHWKSVGGILALQEKIAAAWEQRNAPIEAAVVGESADAETVEAVVAEAVEALPAEGGIYQNDRFTVAVVNMPSGKPAATNGTSGKPAAVEAVIAAEPVAAAEVVEAEAIPAAVALEGVVVENFIEAEPVEPAVVVPPAADAPGSPGSAWWAPPTTPDTLGDARPATTDSAGAHVPEPKAPTPVVIPPPAPRVEEPPPLPQPEPVFIPPEPEPVAVAPPPQPEPEPVVAPPEPEPVVVTPVADAPPAPTPEPLPAEAVAEIFTLDAAPSPVAPSPIEPMIPPGEVKAARDAVGDIFSLDVSSSSPVATAPAPAEPKSPPPAPKPVSADEIFSLDADELSGRSQPAPADIFSLDADANPPAAGSGAIPSPVENGSESGESPAPAKPAAPAGKEPMTITKPASNGRPAIKITLVRPGEKSPLG